MSTTPGLRRQKLLGAIAMVLEERSVDPFTASLTPEDVMSATEILKDATKHLGFNVGSFNFMEAYIAGVEIAVLGCAIMAGAEAELNKPHDEQPNVETPPPSDGPIGPDSDGRDDS